MGQLFTCSILLLSSGDSSVNSEGRKRLRSSTVDNFLKDNPGQTCKSTVETWPPRNPSSEPESIAELLACNQELLDFLSEITEEDVFDEEELFEEVFEEINNEVNMPPKFNPQQAYE